LIDLKAHDLASIDSLPLRPSILHWSTDRCMRVLIAVFFISIMLVKSSGLVAFTRDTAQREALGAVAFYAEFAAQLSVICFIALMSVLFLWRLEPVSKAGGLLPRLTAVVGTFLAVSFAFLPRAELSVQASIIATALAIFGNILSLYVLAWLGRSFSIMAEARRLVTGGPYAIVRHPLYFAEEIAFVGAVMHYVSVYALIILAVHLFVQIQRMKNEEAVLRNVYPKYVNYQAATARLIPYIY
jgi:protein-S-isoprenylcysteine O-methyltransferase Ste14